MTRGGVRLRHPWFRAGVLSVEDRRRPYKAPVRCPTCRRTHPVKTYHLTFDGEGYTIVSPQVHVRLVEMGLLGDSLLSYVNDVTAPPAQTLGMGATAKSSVYRHRQGDYELDDGLDWSPPATVPMPSALSALAGAGRLSHTTTASGLIVVRKERGEG
ncbi:MAG TPA: hypothetical protein VIV06_10835 [Candidatus Limnocylindrales bacterium]